MILLASCGETQKKPNLEQTIQEKSETTVNSENDAIIFNTCDYCYLDLRATQTRKLQIDLKPRSEVKSIHLTVLFEDRLLIGEKTIKIDNKYFYESYIVKIDPIDITMPSNTRSGQMVTVCGESDKGTQCKIQFLLRDQLAELTLKMSEEQKRSSIIDKYEKQTGIKTILLNELGNLAFIDNENYLSAFQIVDYYDNSYNQIININVNRIDSITLRKIKEPGQIDSRTYGLGVFGYESKKVMYLVSYSLKKDSFRPLAKPLIDGKRKVYLLKDNNCFVSIDEKQEISDVFALNQDHYLCSYSMKYPDSFFVEFNNPDGPSSPLSRFSIINGVVQDNELVPEDMNDLIYIGN